MPFVELLDGEIDATLSYRPPTAVTLPAAGDVTLTSEGGRRGTSTTTTGSPGHYHLRTLIGRGGMGEVWAALQVTLGRVVAVKSPIVGGDAEPRRLAAFRQEALVAAQLEHPNIVPVHDQGADHEGRPLLAMKLVQGRAWDSMLKEDLATLTIEERLERHLPILVDVAQAVAFAHSKGIIHRDIKPSQVMVGSFGEVMLMDWGLAMFIGDTGALEQAVRGEFPTRDSCSNPSGTPAMMAPEQTRDSPNQLSERTDVYLLGGTLYYILTGTYPHPGTSAQDAFDRASRGVLDPPQQRTTTPLPEQLVTICTEAMRADPAQRTPSASAFLAQLRDFLSGASQRREALAIADGVEADLRKDPRSYEALATINTGLGRALSLWPGNPRLLELHDRLLAAHARVALDREDLNLAEVQARQIADQSIAGPLVGEVAVRVASRRRQAAQRRAAVLAVAALLVLIALGSAGFTMQLRSERDAAEEARGQAVAERDEAQRQRLRAQEAESVAEQRRQAVEAKSASLRKARLDADGLVTFMLGDLRGRLAELERLDLLDSVAERAATYYSGAPFEELDDDERAQAIAGMGALSEVFVAQGNLADAAATAGAAAGFARRAFAESPGHHQLGIELLSTLGRQARIAFEQGDLGAALELHQEALTLGNDLLESGAERLKVVTLLSITHADLGKTYKGLGQLKDSRMVIEESVRMMEELADADPSNLGTSRELAARYSNLAGLQADERLYDESLASLERSRDIMKSLVTAQPENGKWQLDYAKALQSTGHILARLSRLDEAEAQLTESHQILEVLLAGNPTNMELVGDVAVNLHYVARLQRSQGHMGQAAATYRHALKLWKELALRDPSNAQTTHMGVVLRYGLAGVLSATGDSAPARDLYAENCAVLDDLLALDPSNAFWLRELGSNLYSLAETHACTPDADSMQQAAERSRDIYRQLVASNPQVIASHDMEQACGFLVARAARLRGDHRLAIEEEAARFIPLDILIARQPDEDIWRREKAAALLSISADHTALSEPTAALDKVTEAMAVRLPGAGVPERWQALTVRAAIAEGFARQTAGETAAGTERLREGRDLALQLIAETSLGDIPALTIMDLIAASRALGEPVDPAWAAHVRLDCLTVPPEE